MTNFNIVGIPVKRLLFQGTLAAVAGTGAGRCYRNLKEHPGTGTQILKYSIVAGTCGGIFGCTYGLFRGGGIVLIAMSQTMYWSLATAYFSNVRSLIKNSELKFPGQDEPLKDIVVNSVTTGITAITSCLFITSNPTTLFSSASIGICLGFLGHHIYEELRILRLEFLLQIHNKELILQKEEADAYIDEQLSINPYYNGPKQERYRIVEYLSSIWLEHQRSIEENLAKEKLQEKG